jgi:hypothetical protein
METAAVTRARCPNCAWWDPDKCQGHFSLAEMTEWRPDPGLDPHMRQFKCEACGRVFYLVRREYE